MLVVWGRANSVNVQKVLWCCAEMGLAYERKDAGGPFGIVNTPEYRRMNPNGLVPTIVDDDLVLWESHAIVRYLAARHSPGGLCPADQKARAVADQWMDWHVSTLWPALRPLFLGLIRTPPEQRDLAGIESARKKCAEALEMLDHRLTATEYVAGDTFTMADIALGCGVWRWMALPIERPSLPSAQRWFDMLARRPAFKEIVMQPLS